MNVALVGAIDRYNYGDVLFPIIVKSALEKRIKNIEFEFYGYEETDLTRYGAYPTKAMREMNLKETDCIIIVGGEVLTSMWSHTYLHLLKDDRVANILNKIGRLIRQRLFTFLARKKMGYSRPFPWIFSGSDFDGIKVIYNSVGGAACVTKKSYKSKILADSLNEADYISVREEKSREGLVSIGVNEVIGAPDCAFIMSDMFPLIDLRARISSPKFDLTNPYICFQIGLKYAEGNIDKIVNELANTLRRTTNDLVLLPIGVAALHEDIKPLSKIAERLKPKFGERVVLVDDNTIYDTMYIVANSDLFIGTSLHGNVTAISYGKPCVGLDPRVVKLNELLKSYSIPNQQYGVSYERIEKSIRSALATNLEDIEKNSKKIKRLVDENFDRIVSVLIDV